MAYNPATDFVGVWRRSGGNVSKAEMPGLDFVIAALARAGVITLSVSATAPVVNQSTTAWLQAAVPSFSGEGSFKLWDAGASAYAAATPALFLKFLQATAGQNGVSWWTSTGGPPLNTVGNNGDFAIRTDNPGGIYGPKAGGAWPGTAIPGTVDIVTSMSLDNAFGNTPGELLRRGAGAWEALPVGTDGQILNVSAGLPGWVGVSALFDALFGSARGSIFIRGAAAWSALPPGTAGQVLQTGGAGADPSWAPKTPEFASGTVLLFYQAAAPTGWTKQVALDDYAVRVVAGAGGISHPGSTFSSVFAQTVTGNHTLTIPEIPAHDHQYLTPNGTSTTGGGAFSVASPSALFNTGPTGGGGPHNHPISLTPAYVDVIIAAKD